MDINYFDVKCLYNLQMNYMLLWSLIDKYLALCNGGWFQRNNVIEWSKYSEFGESFNITRNHEVYSSSGASSYKLNPENARSSAEYYYQLRCNIVHNGKIQNPEATINLEQSLNELLDIFENVLKISFNPDRYFEYAIEYW